MYTYYLKALMTLVVIICSFGFGVPYLVSAPSTVMVIAGVALLVITPLIIHFIWSDEIDKITSYTEEAIKGFDKKDTKENTDGNV